MALIADLCPNCQRVTRCHVAERGSVVGGLVLGIPFVLPSSSVSCCCGECGCEFKSQTWDYQKYLSPGEAMSLDIEAILSLTNPALKEQLALSKLKAVPELGAAFRPPDGGPICDRGRRLSGWRARLCRGLVGLRRCVWYSAKRLGVARDR